MTLKSKILPDKGHAPGAVPAWEIRALRFVIAMTLVIAALITLKRLLDKPILDVNKLEVGLLLGWLIAKSGTVIDWLFGGSESGTRRADAAATSNEAPTALPPPPSRVTETTVTEVEDLTAGDLDAESR